MAQNRLGTTEFYYIDIQRTSVILMLYLEFEKVDRKEVGKRNSRNWPPETMVTKCNQEGHRKFIVKKILIFIQENVLFDS